MYNAILNDDLIPMWPTHPGASGRETARRRRFPRQHPTRQPSVAGPVPPRARVYAIQPYLTVDFSVRVSLPHGPAASRRARRPMVRPLDLLHALRRYQPLRHLNAPVDAGVTAPHDAAAAALAREVAEGRGLAWDFEPAAPLRDEKCQRQRQSGGHVGCFRQSPSRLMVIRLTLVCVCLSMPLPTPGLGAA